MCKENMKRTTEAAAATTTQETVNGNRLELTKSRVPKNIPGKASTAATAGASDGSSEFFDFSVLLVRVTKFFFFICGNWFFFARVTWVVIPKMEIFVWWKKKVCVEFCERWWCDTWAWHSRDSLETGKKRWRDQSHHPKISRSYKIASRFWKHQQIACCPINFLKRRHVLHNSAETFNEWYKRQVHVNASRDWPQVEHSMLTYGTVTAHVDLPFLFFQHTSLSTFHKTQKRKPNINQNSIFFNFVRDT